MIQTICISKNLIIKGISIVNLIFENNLTSSKSEARRVLNNKGIRVNDNIITDEKKMINLEDFADKNYIKLSVGKKTHIKIKII